MKFFAELKRRHTYGLAAGERQMRRIPFVLMLVAVGTAAASQSLAVEQSALIVRAKSLELNTPYVPPPGHPLQHDTSGFAKIIRPPVFITRLDPDSAAEYARYFT